MKRLKHMLGVTLLEIMLVLAIAAMIIVMSIRYYQSATSSAQVNYALQQIQAIGVAMDGLAQASGSYLIGGSAISPLLPPNGLTTPWGTAIQVNATGTNTYTMNLISIPPSVCPLLQSKLSANIHYSITGSCTNLTITYNSSA